MMDWHSFFGVILFGIAAASTAVFLVSLVAIMFMVINPISICGITISFSVGLLCTATLHGLGWDQFE